MKIIFLFLLISINAFGMATKIRCDRLEGRVDCIMAHPNSQFLTVNNVGILFNHGSRCEDASCDWIGYISAYALYDGSNHADFSVRTKSDDPNVYTKMKFSFYFGGVFKDSLVSTRQGTEVDRSSIEFDLSLEEIDPALYNEYLELRDEYDSSVGTGENPSIKYDKLAKSLAEINKRIQDLTALADSIKDKQFDEIDAETLAKLGIAENQIKLLKAKKEELTQYSTQSQQTREQVQTQVIARYEAVRARARTYDSNLPDLPINPGIDQSQFKISAFVQELNNELNSILLNLETAISDKNFEKYRTALKDWKRSSDHAVSIYTQSADINATEKALLYNTIYQGSINIFKDGVSNDAWRKINQVPENIRKTIDDLADEGYQEAKDLRNKLNFQKINPEIDSDLKISLSKVERLATKLKGYEAKNDLQNDAKKIATAVLKVSLSSIADAVVTGLKKSLFDADLASEIGLTILDIGIDFIPGVSTARSAVELFTGRNIVTKEEFTKFDYSLAFVNLFLGLGGVKISKTVFETSTELISKIGIHLKLPWTKTAREVGENLPQVENLFDDASKLGRKYFSEILTPSAVNDTIKKKFPRFSEKAFGGSVVFKRVTESGEKYCRVIGQKAGQSLRIISDEGGYFVFRCKDIMFKTMDIVFDMAAIPDKDKYVKIFVAEIIPPIRTAAWEGIAAPAFKLTGGAIQILLDITDKKIIDYIQDSARVKEVVDVFRGF